MASDAWTDLERRDSLTTPVVAWLVGVLAAAHFLQWTVVQAADVQQWLGFRAGDVPAGRWWTALTYALVQPSVELLVLNAYALQMFGPRVERFLGTRRFAGFVALAALGGWIAQQFVGGATPLLGASAIALGVMGVYALRWGAERRPSLGGILTTERGAVTLVASIVLLVGMQAPGDMAFLAHLGGLAMAWILMRATPTLFVERVRERVATLPDEPPEDQPPQVVPKTLPKSRAQQQQQQPKHETIDDVVARTNAERVAPRQPPSVNAILDKINAEGIARLTDEERRVLDDHSRRLRDQ